MEMGSGAAAREGEQQVDDGAMRLRGGCIPLPVSRFEKMDFLIADNEFRVVGAAISFQFLAAAKRDERPNVSLMILYNTRTKRTLEYEILF